MPREELRNFPVMNDGSKKTTVKIRKKKYEISYLSKKEYREKLNETDCHTELLGYTSLKRKHIKKNAARDDRILGLLTLNNLSVSAIERNKRKFRSVKGYICVAYNRYVAIEKYNPMFILLFLLLGFLCISAALGFFRNEENPKPPWFPVLEEIIDVGDEEKNEIPNIQVAGFSAWYIPAGETENISVSLKNPKENPCYFSFDITLENTGELIYRSDMVQPGDTIKKINLLKPLDAGKYTAIVHISTNEIATGKEMNDASFAVALTVK